MFVAPHASILNHSIQVRGFASRSNLKSLHAAEPDEWRVTFGIKGLADCRSVDWLELFEKPVGTTKEAIVSSAIMSAVLDDRSSDGNRL